MVYCLEQEWILQIVRSPAVVRAHMLRQLRTAIKMAKCLKNYRQLKMSVTGLRRQIRCAIVWLTFGRETDAEIVETLMTCSYSQTLFDTVLGDLMSCRLGCLPQEYAIHAAGQFNESGGLLFP
jgi:hypothetical protein